MIVKSIFHITHSSFHIIIIFLCCSNFRSIFLNLFDFIFDGFIRSIPLSSHLLNFTLQLRNRAISILYYSLFLNDDFLYFFNFGHVVIFYLFFQSLTFSLAVIKSTFPILYLAVCSLNFSIFIL